jgi:hypothetical protein
MILTRRIAICLVSANMIVAGSSWADVSNETSAGRSLVKDRHMSLKNSIESKVSELKSIGRDRTWSTNTKKSAQRGGSTGLDLAVPARSLVPEEIEYKLPADFGLAVLMKNGMIDLTTAEYLSQAAKTGASVRDVAGVDSEIAVKVYIYHISQFAARVAQSQLLLNDWIGQIGGIKRRGGVYEVTGLGADDLVTLATGAWEAACAMGDNFKDTRIRRDFQAINYDNAAAQCRLSGDNSVACGPVVIHLSAPPTLKFRGVVWYGETFAGISGSYKVSSNWSWQRAAEDSAGSSAFVKQSSDEAESEGRALEAVQMRKKAVEKSRSNKASLGTNKVGAGH